jgi:hypothetical protein
VVERCYELANEEDDMLDNGDLVEDAYAAAEVEGDMHDEAGGDTGAVRPGKGPSVSSCMLLVRERERRRWDRGSKALVRDQEGIIRGHLPWVWPTKSACVSGRVGR